MIEMAKFCFLVPVPFYFENEIENNFRIKREFFDDAVYDLLDAIL